MACCILVAQLLSYIASLFRRDYRMNIDREALRAVAAIGEPPQRSERREITPHGGSQR